VAHPGPGAAAARAADMTARQATDPPLRGPRPDGQTAPQSVWTAVADRRRPVFADSDARDGARPAPKRRACSLRVCPRTSVGLQSFRSMRRIEARRKNANLCD